MPALRTLARPFRLEIPKIKGSRFLADVGPAADAEAALAFVADRRREMPDATHHCWAYRLGTDDELRYSDDGEPSGSAGRPILKELEGRELRCVVAVVTRWYGGTKLGTGGLVRAYSGAVAAALDAGPLVERAVTQRLRVEHAYDATGDVAAVLAAFELESSRSAYGERVTLELDVPVESIEALRSGLRDATAGRARVHDLAQPPR